VAKLEWEKASRRAQVAESSREVAQSAEERAGEEEERWRNQYSLARAVLDAIGEGRYILGVGDADRIVSLYGTNRSRNAALEPWCKEHEVTTRAVREELRDAAPDAVDLLVTSKKIVLPHKHAVANEHRFQLQLRKVAARYSLDPAILWSALEHEQGRQEKRHRVKE